MILYGLKTCDTCRKARKALPGAAFVDLRTEGIPQEVMEAAWTAFGRALINTRSTTWRSLSEAERETDPRELLAAHPALMKRPLIVADGRMWLGWNAQVQAEIGAVS